MCAPRCTPPQVTFNVEDPAFKLADLLALELHKFEDEVSEIVDRAQKEEKMEFGLKKLEDTWTKVSFQFNKHKDTDVFTVKLAEEDFEVGLEQGQLQPTALLYGPPDVAGLAFALQAKCVCSAEHRLSENGFGCLCLQMLEDNQVLIQGMMANRYMDTFRDSILSWNKKLMAVADVVAIAGEIQVGVRDACAATSGLCDQRHVAAGWHY